ncbi:MAG: ATP-binding protein [Vicinamibacteria bacterium]
MPGALVPRPALLAALRERALRPAPLLLAGPPGAGKTTLLAWLAGELERQGAAPVYLDLFGAASSPAAFVEAALDALPAGRFAERLGEAQALRSLAAAGRAQAAEAVLGVLRLLAALEASDGRPVVLLLDEPTEIRSLAYFKGLREVQAALADALSRRRSGTVVATSFPTQSTAFLPFERQDVAPLSAAEIGAVVPGPRGRDLLRGSFGWAYAVRALAETGGDVRAAWQHEMQQGGRLEAACRGTYESLLLRSRGYGMSKALLAQVALREGQNLTELYRRVRRSPGATRDYLGWLLGVDVLRSERKRYFFSDGLLRLWLLLHCRGRLARARDVEQAAEALFAPAGAAEAALPEAPEAVGAGAARELAAAADRLRRDSLIEID